MRPLDAPPTAAASGLFARFVLLNFVVFVLFVATDLRALGRGRSE